MIGGLRLGRLFGIPIQINFSFLLLLGLLIISQGLRGAILLLLVFASVLVHELGHALVARRYRVPILGIDLHFFGGTAKMGRMPSSPREEIVIAAAGPLVSFGIALASYLFGAVTQLSGLTYLTTVNLLLGGFNLLPALPMDGGRIFRGLLARRLGRLRATAVAVKVAHAIALGLGVFALARLNFLLAGLAVMLWFLASAELRTAQLWSYAREQGGSALWPDFSSPHDAVEVLDREGRRVDGGAPGRFTVEEQQGNGMRRWIVRDPAGNILFVAEHPLRW